MAFTKLLKKLNPLSFITNQKNNISEINGSEHSNFLNTFYLNIRSFNKNNLELQIYLNSFNFRFDFIILVEIWSNSEFSTDKYIQGYALSYVLSSFNKNGGVAIYSKIGYDICTLDLSDCLDTIDNKNIDMLGIQFILNAQKYVLLGIYNHNQNKIESFHKILLNFLNRFGKVSNIIIASDLNINLLKYSVLAPITEFVDSLIDNNIKFIVDSPTRITKNSRTLIDNFLLYGFSKDSEIFYSNLNC